jgi:hypothetical protein
LFFVVHYTFAQNKDWHDINMVFASMLIAAGIAARVAKVAARADYHFNQEPANMTFLLIIRGRKTTR